MKEMVTKMEMVLQQISILQAQHAASAAPPPAAVEGLPLASKDDLMLLEASLMDPQEEQRVVSTFNGPFRSYTLKSLTDQST